MCRKLIKLTYIEVKRLLHEKKIWIVFIALFAALLLTFRTYLGYHTNYRTANDALVFQFL